MKKLLFILLLVPMLVQAQIKYSLDDNLTGTYATSKAGDQTSVVINGLNHFVTKENVYFDINPYYSLKYSGTRNIDNEFLIREDIGYKDSGLSVFAVHQYNSSLIRGISSDNWCGLGVGKMFKLSKNLMFGVSYCTEYEYRKYTMESLETVLRNSFRAKLKLDVRDIQFNFEYYFQPSVDNMSDINIFGTASLTFFNSKSISFTVQNVYNYMSTDKIKTIQSTSFGMKFKMKSNGERKRK